MTGMLCTAFRNPSRAIQSISMLPTSWIIFFDSGLNGLQAWFCRRSCWRACRSGWFSIFCINYRTLVLCACFTTECGNPGIRKSMFTSFNIVCSWLVSSWFTTGCSDLSRSVLSPTLIVSLSWQERVWELFGTFSVFVPTTGLPVPFMCLFNVGILTVFRWTCLDYTRFNNGVPRSIRRKDVFLPSCTVLVSVPTKGRPYLSVLTTGCPDLPRLGFGIDWFDWKLPNCCTTCPSGCWACSEPKFSFPVVFQGDLWWRPRWHACFSLYDFSSFHPNNFRKTISWKCCMKNDSVRSSLIELQSFLHCKIDVDPIHCVLMFIHASCMYCAWRGTLKSIVSGSLWFLFMGSTGRKNTVCLLLKIWPPSTNPELMMECKLIAHQTWYMYWKKLLWITTLSCKV